MFDIYEHETQAKTKLSINHRSIYFLNRNLKH